MDRRPTVLRLTMLLGVLVFFKASKLVCVLHVKIKKLKKRERQKYKSQTLENRAVKFLFEYSGHFCLCKHYKTLSIFEYIPQ